VKERFMTGILTQEFFQARKKRCERREDYFRRRASARMYLVSGREQNETTGGTK
jgi:hypothetical protein